MTKEKISEEYNPTAQEKQIDSKKRIIRTKITEIRNSISNAETFVGYDSRTIFDKKNTLEYIAKARKSITEAKKLVKEFSE